MYIECPPNGHSLRAAFALVVVELLTAPTTFAAESHTDAGHLERQASVGQKRFGWPSAGRVMWGFCWGPNHDGKEGINIAAMPGTEVRAAEAGRIAYAGDDLKGFQGLILISHPDGWVSAYANTDGLLVKRGDAVERGQVIARVDDGAMLHFELRHHAAAVDPMLYLGDAAPEVAQKMQGQCRG
jgi:murein DD-endopeptidase MepM/ murein hydrolase activator NlpD